VRALRAVFASHSDANGNPSPITLATIRQTYHLDCHAHIDARHQEGLLSLDMALGQDIALWGLELVRDAVTARARTGLDRLPSDAQYTTALATAAAPDTTATANTAAATSSAANAVLATTTQAAIATAITAAAAEATAGPTAAAAAAATTDTTDATSPAAIAAPATTIERRWEAGCVRGCGAETPQNPVGSAAAWRALRSRRASARVG
jgi:cytoskeletal protein RodZ